MKSTIEKLVKLESEKEYCEKKIKTFTERIKEIEKEKKELR